MKKLLYIVAIFIGLSINSCSGFLDSQNVFQETPENFFRGGPTNILQALSGVYEALYVEGGQAGLGNEHLLATVIADYAFAGGDTAGDWIMHAMADFAHPGEATMQTMWRRTFEGVHRANTLKEALAVTDLSAFFATEAEKTAFVNTVMGEAYFMRGFLMFRAARLWGEMPLIVSTGTPRDVPRSSLTETWGQIAADFNRAIELLPRVNIRNRSVNDDGRATVWTAKAFLARTYLHYTGFMTNMMGTPTTVLTLPDGSTITNAQVVAHLEDVKANSGHALVPDFRNLWPYAHINTLAGFDVFPWAAQHGLQWVGQDGPNGPIGSNTETMFAQRNAHATGWDASTRFRNGFTLYAGLRNQTSTQVFGEGWGFATVNPLLYEEWPADDLRRDATIFRVAYVEGYNATANDGAHQTGLNNKKYASLVFTPQVGPRTGFWWYLNRAQLGGSWTNAFHQMQDFVYLRFADVYLMHSELTQTANGINTVRARVGLPPVAFSMTALQNERLWEFAFEGVRWFDLVRWGVTGVPNFWGRPVQVLTVHEPVMHTNNFRPETRGLLLIPPIEVTLADGIYTQNPGW